MGCVVIRLRSSIGGQHVGDAEPRLLVCDVHLCPNTVQPVDVEANGWVSELLPGILRVDTGAVGVQVVDLCSRHAHLADSARRG